MTDRKQVRSVRLKDEDEGKVRAVVATTGAVDADGDIIEPGAFGTQDVVVSGFGHTSWEGAPPVGKGAVTESGDKAVADLQFFLDTSHGRDLFTTMKNLGKLGEWSFGFDVKGQRDPTPSEREDGAVRVLEALEVHEVSPVLRGAGVDTGTLAAKCDACGSVAGEAVDPAAAREALEAGRKTLRKLDGKVDNGTISTVLRHPDREIQKLGRFATEVAWQLAGYPGLPWQKRAPQLRWFIPSLHPRTKAYMVPGEHEVYVSLRQAGRDLCHSILHEAAHHGQDDPKAHGAERGAESFASRWSGAVVAAYRAASGDASSVHVKRGRPPWHGRTVRPGDVVLSRSDGRAYSYYPRHSSPWKELAT